MPTTYRTRRILTAALLGLAICQAPAAQAQVTFDWATVGNAGNAADAATGYGAVDYDYRIAKTEVTSGQYAEFLNAASKTHTYSLWNFHMDGHAGSEYGISRSGSNGNYSYAVAPGGENKAITYISWFNAARFANWMTNGQGSGDTESGTYTLAYDANAPSASSSSLVEITRDLTNPNQVFIPTEDEWYKAAYHDASAGTAGDYFIYATGSNDVPISDRPEDNPAAVNYFNDDGVENGFNDGPAIVGGPADVGLYTEAASPYGTFDQNGNASEVTETLFDNGFNVDETIYRGGAWVAGSSEDDNDGYYGHNTLLSSYRHEDAAYFGPFSKGFRVAAPVPEPGSLALLAFATPLILRRRRG